MRIFVNTGVLLHDGSEDYHYFLKQVLKIVIDRNREHEFIILSHDADARSFSADNVTHVKMRNILGHWLAVKVWYDLKLPAILKKHKADLFISFEGFCSLTTAIPQFILFNPALSDSPAPGGLRSLFYKRFMRKALNKAKTVICFCDFRKKDVMLRYFISDSKLAVVYPSVKETFRPVDEDVKEEVRVKFCDGKNYFAYAGTMQKREELFNILKAFSAFKKRQKSDWKLLLMGSVHQYDRKFMDSLATYKYRSDVVVAKNDDEDERVNLIGSAYAVICAVHSESTVFPLLQSMKCGVPVITADTAAGKEVSGGDALYFDPEDSENIAQLMMTIYKDESFRSTLIEKGKLTAMKYTFDKSATLFRECISPTKADYKSHGMD